MSAAEELPGFSAAHEAVVGVLSARGYPTDLAAPTVEAVLRALEPELREAEHGRRLMEASRRGAAKGNRERMAAKRAAIAETVRLASALLEGNIPSGERCWTVANLSAEVRESWKSEGQRPSVRTIDARIREAIEVGELPAWIALHAARKSN